MLLTGLTLIQLTRSTRSVYLFSIPNCADPVSLADPDLKFLSADPTLRPSPGARDPALRPSPPVSPAGARDPALPSRSSSPHNNYCARQHCSAEIGGDSSSSGEEDGDAEWRAAINSVATTAPSNRSTVVNGTATISGGSPARENKADVKNIKLYQIKAQKLLDDILEKSLQVVRQEPTEVAENHSIVNGGGVRLFRDAPPGILFDQVDELQGPLKRPRIVPNVEIDEKSRKFRKQLKSVVVDGDDIICSAKEACERSLAMLEARDAAAKAKAKRDEERVAELKKVRGERWLPAIARQMQLSKD